MICNKCIHEKVCGNEVRFSEDDIRALTYCGEFKDKELNISIPCKIGNIVYIIHSRSCIGCDYLLNNDCDMTSSECKFDKYEILEVPFSLELLKCIDKTVFLGKINAERELEKFKNENK